MSLSVAIQMDEIEPIDINADSTFALAEEAQVRGHRLYHYLVKDLSLKTGRVAAWGRPLEVRREIGNHATLNKSQELDLSEMDVFWKCTGFSKYHSSTEKSFPLS